MIDEILTTFARAGGGGSGGGSGGGGSVLFAIPAVSAMTLGSFVRKKTSSRLAGFFSGLAIGLLIAAFYLTLNISSFIIAIISAISGASIGATTDKIGRFKKNSRMAQATINQAVQSDTAWNPDAIVQYATTVFNRFQYDWQRKDLKSIEKYVTPNYARHIGLMLYAMEQMDRTNTMSNINISEAVITGAHDDADNNRDLVSVSFAASADDQLIENKTGKVITRNTDEFGEQWNFVRSKNGWLLDSIDQETEDSTQIIASMRQFAAYHNMYYSPDWGNLLLPTKGQIFSKNPKTADINNHVIGFWDRNLLVQLYTYNQTANDVDVHYIVGQVNLPKSYGGILVERRNSILKRRLRAPSGYKRVQMEWGDFNKRYQVYATDENQVTSFELLNPSFMAWLYDRDIKVDIEVVNNVVYLYAKISAKEMRYAEMMEILKKSHKELKM